MSISVIGDWYDDDDGYDDDGQQQRFNGQARAHCFEGFVEVSILSMGLD